MRVFNFSVLPRTGVSTRFSADGPLSRPFSALPRLLPSPAGLLEVATRPMIASSCLDVPLSAIHPALQKLYRSRIGAASAVVNGTEGAAAEAGKAGAAADEEEEEDAGAAGPSAGKKRKRGSQEGAAQLQELQGQAGGDGGGPGPGPADNFFDEGYAPENIGFDDNVRLPSLCAPPLALSASSQLMIFGRAHDFRSPVHPLVFIAPCPCCTALALQMAGGAFGEGQSQPSTGCALSLLT